MKKISQITLCLAVSLFFLASQASATTMIDDLNVLWGMGGEVVDIASQSMGRGSDISSLTDAFGRTLDFSPAVNHRGVGDLDIGPYGFEGWGTWPSTYGDPFAGDGLDVLFAMNTTELQIDFMPGTEAFGFELEPNYKVVFEMMLTLDDGTTQTKFVDGDAGALTFGFYGGHVASLTITDVTGGAGGFAIGRLTTTGSPVPEPATLLLLGSGLIGMFGFKKRKKDIS